ncbi:MAG: hypothetical protein MZV63_47715 [Marinilabiliales bacterium]|nr:hypothetical protein [Marinilabiliales bacterium]
MLQGREQDSTVTNMENPADIKQVMLLEEWFFDKKHSRLDVRIIGICPIYMGYDQITARLVKRRLFWIRYEDVRQALASQRSIQFISMMLSVSHLRTSCFSASLTDISWPNQTSMMTGQSTSIRLAPDRSIEAERIKNEIFNFEQDLWEY